MSVQTCLELTLRLISFAVLLQTIELLQIRKSWKIWFSKISDVLFQSLLIVQVLFCIGNLFAPQFFFSAGILIILIVQFVRFRGFFNGGADGMTFTVLLSGTLVLCFPHSSKIQVALIWYIALQAILSYFIAGIVKAKHKDWWSGKALEQLLTNSTYVIPQKLIHSLKSPTAKVLSIGILSFELLSPLGLLSKTTADLFILLAIIFHFANFFILGLNRFIFAWLAAYPAVYFLAGSW